MSEAAQLEPRYDEISADWTALQVLTEKVGRNLLGGQRELLFNLSNWFLAADLFKDFEEARLVLREAQARDREFHRVTLTQLLSSGEKLLQQLGKSEEIKPAHIGVTLADVAATLDNLRLTYTEYYGGMTDGRKREILEGIFGAKA
jgi:hypothetical protein